jgi:cytochrome c-type biogenesis protein CcmH
VGIFKALDSRLRGNDGLRWTRMGVMLAALLSWNPAFAGEAAPNAEDPVIEQRLIKLAEELRCLVCQNESLAGSHAELAEDLRKEIRAQMKAGKNDKEVIEYLTQRYGDFVLYQPPFKPVTYLLWLGPLLFLLIGAGVWYVTLKKRRALKNTPVDPQQLATAEKLLDEK